KNDQLPSPKIDIAHQIAVHSGFEQSLQGIIHTHKNSIADKSKNDGIGVQGSDSAEGSIRITHIGVRPEQLYRRREAYNHAYNPPHYCGNCKILDNLVVVIKLFQH